MAAIGPLGFRFAEWVTARMPRLDPLAEVEACGETLLSVEEDGRLFLVIDHRSGGPGAARVEMWLPSNPGEGGVEALFVLCDALRPHAPVQHPSGLASLADFLTQPVV